MSGSESTRPIVVVGSANAERLIQVDKLRAREKHVVRPSVLTAGGSAVNYACRLLNAGHEVLPIMPFGDDEVGGLVRSLVLDSARRGGHTDDYQQKLAQWLDKLMQRGESTGFSTILVEADGGHMSFNEPATTNDRFDSVCDNAMAEIDPRDVAGVVIGHIHADASKSEKAAAEGGGITSEIIDRFAGRCRVVANLGSSQFTLGVQRWIEELKRVDLFQLSLAEIRSFLATSPETPPDLKGMLGWLQEQDISSVITLDRFGALGVLGGDDRVVVGWPYELGQSLVDTTGAGDATAAGVILQLTNESSTSLDRDVVCRALDRGRLWAAYACTTIGGAEGCPTGAELEAFKSATEEYREVEVMSHSDDLDAILWLIDRAFACE